jgi:hypothetical protein
MQKQGTHCHATQYSGGLEIRPHRHLAVLGAVEDVLTPSKAPPPLRPSSPNQPSCGTNGDEGQRRDAVLRQGVLHVPHVKHDTCRTERRRRRSTSLCSSVCTQRKKNALPLPTKCLHPGTTLWPRPKSARRIDSGKRILVTRKALLRRAIVSHGPPGRSDPS